MVVKLMKSLKKTKNQVPKVDLCLDSAPKLENNNPYKEVGNKCDICINCLKEKNKPKADEDKFKCEQVNIVVFSTIFLSTLIFYTCIWTNIAYNQKF